MSSEPRVLVIGGGVIGLSAALALRRAGMAVQVWTRDLPPTTTSWIAGAFFYPVRVAIDERTTTWLRDSFAHFADLAATAPQAGVIMREGFELLRRDDPIPTWLSAVGGSRPAAADELPPGYERGLCFSCPVIDTHLYLEWLLRENLRLGVDYRIRTATCLNDSAGHADLVVVASGLGTRDLVVDPSLMAMRGQVVVLDRALNTRVILDEHDPRSVTYIVARRDTSVLGGVAQVGDEDCQPRAAETQAILQRCIELEPTLAQARILETRAGLRPFRATPRLELIAATAERPAIVFNYGHGGAGITLSWGCAKATVELARHHFGRAHT